MERRALGTPALVSLFAIVLGAGACGAPAPADGGHEPGPDAHVDAALDATADGEAGADASANPDVAVDVTAPNDSSVDAASDAASDAATPSLCPAPDAPTEPTEQLYVAPAGHDSAAGTMAAPLASLGEAARRMPMGGTVIVRGGTYGAQHIAGQGLAGHPLFIRAADGEVPVFDGAAVTGQWGAVLAFSSVSHVVLQGLEIANCHAQDCTGISAPPVLDLTVRDCHIHDMDSAAARFSGHTIRFEGNHFHDVALTNVNNTAYPNGGWPTCMGTMPNNTTPSTPLADDVVIRDNRIENCWGEGIGLWFASHAVVEGNVVDNSFSVGIYMDNSPNVTITRNFVHVSRGIHGSHGSGIMMGTEPYTSSGWAPSACSDIAITNNVVVAGTGIAWWKSPDTSSSNTYQRVAVSHNTVVATAGGALSFATTATSAPSPSGCTARNNVLAETSNASLGNPAGWSLASNAWLNGARPPVAGATDVMVTATLGTVMSATDVEPLAAVVGNGVGGTGVAVDYACNARDASAPRRGAFER